MKLFHFVFLSFSIVLSLTSSTKSVAQTPPAAVTILNHRSHAVATITDGDSIRVQVERQNTAPEPQNIYLGFQVGESPLAKVVIPAYESMVVSSWIGTLGWYWDAGPAPQPRRRIVAWTEKQAEDGVVILGETGVTVRPRPVILVHGFISGPDVWDAYLREGGYLDSLGLEGFAVGDGQVAGRLKTGNVLNPTEPTNTIAQNAEILRSYIAGVKRLTGASQVDLVAHSMGGLISRYYIDRLMQRRDVAQLLMLGTPHGGSDCANLPASLGFYLPAALELRPSYLNHIFNKQITRRRGVPFHFLAGTPITEAYKCPCSGVPSDIVVSLESAYAIAATDVVSALPILHTKIAKSPDVYREFVKPLLCKSTEEFTTVTEHAIPEKLSQEFEFSRVFAGRVSADTTAEVVVNVEEDVALCSFALYDPTRTLTVTVRGAAGSVIPLDSTKHGLRIIEESNSLVYMSYGFDHPKEGVWRVTIQSTADTPEEGAPFAIFARMQGSVKLTAATDVLLPEIEQPVEIRGRLTFKEEALPVHKAQAVIRAGDGQTETVPLTLSEGRLTGVWQPRKAGIYGIDVVVEATMPDGVPIKRSAFLVLEVQPGVVRTWMIMAGMGVILMLILGRKSIQICRRIRKRAGIDRGPALPVS